MHQTKCKGFSLGDLVFLSFPFSGIGIDLGIYHLSFSMLLYLIWAVAQMLNDKMNTRILCSALLLIATFILSNLNRNPIKSYILPLAVVIVFLISLSVIDRLIVSRKTYWLSLILLLSLMLFELVFGNLFMLGWLKFEEVIGLKGATQYYHDFRRLRGASSEPSVLAIVLNLFIVVGARSRYFRDNSFGLGLIILAVLLTGSTLGLVLLLLTLALVSRRSSSSYKRLILPVILLSPFALLSPVNFMIIQKAVEKIYLISEVIREGNIIGSVGSRVHSALISIDHFKSAIWFNRIMGEGFSNFDEYVREKYGNIDFSNFQQGEVTNSLSAIYLSSGLLGLGAFFMLIVAVVRRRNDYLWSLFFLIIIFFSFGNITDYIFYMSIFILGLKDSQFAS